MFSFYTRGMSFVDIALLKKKNVFPAEICYKRHKTDQLMRVGINREISRILERYKNVPGEYMFPLFTEEEEPYTGYRNAYHKISLLLEKDFPVYWPGYSAETSRGTTFMGHNCQGKRSLGPYYR